MLSDEKLIRTAIAGMQKIFPDVKTGLETALADLAAGDKDALATVAALRAVAEAAVKDAVGGDEPVAFIDYHDLKVMKGDETFEPVVSSYKLPHDIPLYTRPQASAAVPGLLNELISLLMNAAAELETASFCLTDPGAKKSAEKAAEYYRNKSRHIAASQPEVSDGNNPDS